MSNDWVIDHGDGSFTGIVPDMTESEALAYMAFYNSEYGTTGILNTRAAWDVGPVQQAIYLTAAKQTKLAELDGEGNRRVLLLDSAIDSIEVAAYITVMAQTLSSTGMDINDNVIAYDGAVIDINALTTVAEVEAYDVVTDPAWP